MRTVRDYCGAEVSVPRLVPAQGAVVEYAVPQRKIRKRQVAERHVVVDGTDPLGTAPATFAYLSELVGFAGGVTTCLGFTRTAPHDHVWLLRGEDVIAAMRLWVMRILLTCSTHGVVFCIGSYTENELERMLPVLPSALTIDPNNQGHLTYALVQTCVLYGMTHARVGEEVRYCLGAMPEID